MTTADATRHFPFSPSLPSPVRNARGHERRSEGQGPGKESTAWRRWAGARWYRYQGGLLPAKPPTIHLPLVVSFVQRKCPSPSL